MERWKILAGLVSFTFFMKKHPAVITAIAFQLATFTSLAHKLGASPYQVRLPMSTNNSQMY